MTANRRIFLNVAATYARSFYTLALSLLTARWLILSLGQMDYGLFGLVGGLVAFVGFLNQMFSSAVARFYSLSIGAARKRGVDRARGLTDCRRWFTAALSLHLVLPTLLMLVGWPLGELAVARWLVIPDGRVAACGWVWRFACLSAYVGMVNVPFRAMYVARQEIAELTGWNVLEATAHALLLYFMVRHPGDWLARYAFWQTLLVTVPRLAIGCRAWFVYPECRIVRERLGNWADIRELASYAGWNAFSTVGRVIRGKGMQILVNLACGPLQNAAVTVAVRLAGRANTFAASVITAFTPAITSAYGAGRLSRMYALSCRLSKFSATLVALVSAPLVLEVDEVMRFWLKRPPSDSPFLCACVLAGVYAVKIASGSHVAIMATGRVALYQFGQGILCVAALLIGGAFLAAGCGVRAVGYTELVSAALMLVWRVWSAQRTAGIAATEWLRRVASPVTFAMLAALAAGTIPRLVLTPSLGRVVLTTVCCELVALPLVWFWVLDGEERSYLVEKATKVLVRRR